MDTGVAKLPTTATERLSGAAVVIDWNWNLPISAAISTSSKGKRTYILDGAANGRHRSLGDGVRKLGDATLQRQYPIHI